jgi:hypothetical protein
MQARRPDGRLSLRNFGLLGAALSLLGGRSLAQAESKSEPPAVDAKAETHAESEPEKESPWLLIPTVSVNPKLGGSFGALGAFLHYFDEKSRPSMFGLGGQYTTTQSAIVSAFGRASWNEDTQRAILVMAAGNIKNNYDDYLGTGVPLKTNDQLRAFVGRYLHRVYDDWFLGVQGTYTNYQLLGETAFDDQALDLLGLKGFTSGGIGLSVYHDSRDNENSPQKGFLVNVNNIAYRDWIAGDNNFDVYRADFRDFFPHGDGNVLAVRQFNQLTSDAPASAFAPVQLRGYKVGQYLAEYMSSLEVEERYRWHPRLTSTVFVGTAFLYGNTPSGSDGVNVFPAAGAGVQYVLKPKEGIVINLEAAFGKDYNYGIYLKLGYGF